MNSLIYSKFQKNICSVVVDGFGDRSTASISYLDSFNNIKEIWSCEYPVSVGLFYSAITDFLGFQINEGEYKVMGLSAFGNSKSNMANLVANLIKWDDKTKNIKMDMSLFDYHVSPTQSYSKKLTSLLGEPRNPFNPLLEKDSNFQKFADIAKGAQIGINNILIKIFEFAYELTGVNHFLFSGGVAMNSASIEKIAKLSFIQNLAVPPNPGDGGCSIGSAYYSFLKSTKKESIIIKKPSLFPSKYFYDKEKHNIEKIISNLFEIVSTDKDNILKISGDLIKQGEVIGIIKGHAETGPRSLGNRSLICDGKNNKAVKELNTVIKNRSPFRPTAPCMRYETAKKYYKLREEIKDIYFYMGATSNCRNNSPAINFPTTH